MLKYVFNKNIGFADQQHVDCGFLGVAINGIFASASTWKEISFFKEISPSRRKSEGNRI